MAHIVKLAKIKEDSALIVPESIAKLYCFEKGQKFHLEVKESKNVDDLVILTYATIIK